MMIGHEGVKGQDPSWAVNIFSETEQSPGILDCGKDPAGMGPISYCV